MRQRIDEYLDGGLDPAARKELEGQLASDPAAARLMARMLSERTLRLAALQTYLPTPHESSALAARTLADAYDAPIGHVGYWVRRGAAVAAALILVAGIFTAGRMTATPQIVATVETRTVYSVVYTDLGGELRDMDFATLDERNNFVKELEQRGVTGIAVAEVTTPGHM